MSAFTAWLTFALLWHSPLVAFALSAEELNTISAYQAASPAVVNITTTVLEYDFLLRPVPAAGSGSGIILKDDGTIVTNYHVIADASHVEVTLTDGSHWVAEIAGVAPEHDLAVIRIHPAHHPLHSITLADSDNLQVGEKVLAIGNPFGLGTTLTVGVVSMLGRNIRRGGVVLRELIQTDAAINPGNSGGALVNSKGELIGINTAILSPTGSSVGISFAIPVKRMEKVLPGILTTWGRWLGWIFAILIIYWILRKIYRH